MEALIIAGWVALVGAGSLLPSNGTQTVQQVNFDLASSGRNQIQSYTSYETVERASLDYSKQP